MDAPHAVHADTALVDSLARAFFEAHTLPSLVVGLVDSTGRRVWVYGDADSLGAPDIHTRYEIASITKVFTALALADLAARGTVALDDPVSAYLPDSIVVPEH
ncbi:MAG: serine hydrolase, partial [Bacteroidota bacterium]